MVFVAVYRWLSYVPLPFRATYSTEDASVNLLFTMKNDIHPEYFETTISCTCGVVYTTRSTVKEIQIGICAGCHPFFTGEQKFIDTAGRLEKFTRRYGAQTVRRKKPSLASVSS